MSFVVVGVGSNLGAREASIRCARDLLAARERIAVREVSTIYETEPLGPPQPRYLNAAFRLETDLPSVELLRILIRTERRLGRRRDPDERWGPRSIDLDLLWDERGPQRAPGLQVPHPELRNRDFALAPLLDVVPRLSDEYGDALERFDGPPQVWGREAIVRVESSFEGIECRVEADSLADACALLAGGGRLSGRPWSTRHLRIEPGPEHFANALRQAYRRGFAVHRASISHCASSCWNVELHGVNEGIALDANVRLCTTSGALRTYRAELSLGRVPA